MIIRKGTLDDAAAMADVFNYYVVNSNVIFSNHQLTAEEMRCKLVDLEVGTAYPFFVAEEEGRCHGYAYAHRYHPDPVYGRTWELTMYLAHDSLGKGLGSKMFEMLIDACRKGGAHTLISNVTEGNRACERMHDRAGFTYVGRLPQVGFKFGEYLSDVIYQLML